MKLNIGCGTDIRGGYINIDLYPLPDVDFVWDINNPLLYRDNSVDEILALDIVEHVYDVYAVMDDLCRVLKDGGRIIVQAPHASYIEAYCSLDHRHYLTYHSFDYLAGTRQDSPYTCNRMSVSRRLIYSRKHKTLSAVIDPIINAIPDLYERLFCWILPCEKVEYILTKKPHGLEGD